MAAMTMPTRSNEHKPSVSLHAHTFLRAAAEGELRFCRARSSRDGTCLPPMLVSWNKNGKYTRNQLERIPHPQAAAANETMKHRPMKQDGG